MTRRLARGRELLRHKLTRRGITLAAGAMATSLAEMAAAAPLPALLSIKTVKAVALVAAGKSVPGGCLSARALALAEEAVRGMLGIKGKLVLMVLTLGLAVGGAGWAGLSVTSQPAPTAKAQPPVAKNEVQDAEKKSPATDQHGDPLPEGAVARLGTVRWRHSRVVGFAEFLPDGKNVVSVGSDMTIRVWEWPSGKEIRRIGQPAVEDSKLSPNPNITYFGAAALSKDGTVIAISFNSTKIRRYEVATGKELPGLKAEWPAALAFAPDGTQLAALDKDGTIHIWDCATAQEVRKFAGDGRNSIPRRLLYAPDGKAIASWHIERTEKENTHLIKLWNHATGTEIRQIARVPHPGAEPLSLAFSPDSKTLAFADIRGTIYLADAATGKEVGNFRFDGVGRRTLIFGKDGTKIYSRQQRAMFVTEWDVARGKLLREFGAGAQGQTFLAYDPLVSDSMSLAPDGNTLVMVGGEHAPVFLDIATGNDIAKRDSHGKAILAVQFTPDGRLLTQDSDPSIRQWDVAGGKEVRSPSFPIKPAQVAVSPDGQFFAVWPNGNLVIVDGVTNKMVMPTLKTNTRFLPVHFTGNGKFLAVHLSHYEPIIELYDVASGKLVHRLDILPATPKAGAVTSSIDNRLLTMIASPDGRTLAGYAHLNELVFWDITTGQRIGSLTLPDIEPTDENKLRLDQLPVQSGAFSPDGRCLAIDMKDGTVIVYELATCRPRGTYGNDKAALATVAIPNGENFGTLLQSGPCELRTGPRLAFSPDGTSLAQGGLDQIVHLYDLATGSELAAFKGHTGPLTAVAFAPDGKTVASASWDTTALLWDVAKLRRRQTAPVKRLERGDLETCWQTLAGNDAIKAFMAISNLAGAGSDAVALIKQRCEPAAPVTEKHIIGLIGQLDHEQFQLRQSATKELLAIGEQVLPAVNKALAAKLPLEIHRRLEVVRAQLSGMVLQGERLRAFRAVEVLERIHTAEACAALQTLANGAPGTLIATAAKSALVRLSK